MVRENTNGINRNETSSDLVLVSEILPSNLTILPTIKHPIFPNMMVPLTISDDRSLQIVKAAYEKENRLIGIVLIKEEDKSDFWNSELYKIGTIVKILRITPLGEDTFQMLIQGLQRFTKIRTAWKDPYPKWKVEYYYEPEYKPSDELKAYTLSIMSSLKELLKKNMVLIRKRSILQKKLFIE